MKHFILFLGYTWTACVLGLLLFGVNYFFCTAPHCEFAGAQVHLVRVMAWILLLTLMFTSSMLMNVVYGIITGIGTIDRLKKKATDTWHDATEEAMPLTEIFGIGPYWTWLFPTDPIFDDYDWVMGYTTRQRLLRHRDQTSTLLASGGAAMPQTAKGKRDRDDGLLSSIDV